MEKTTGHTHGNCRDDIPLGFTYNARGQVLTFKGNNGFWYERTYNARGQVLTYRDSFDGRRAYTYNDKGQVLTYRESTGYWQERTYDEAGNELTLSDKTGNWKFLAESGFRLYVNEETGIYWAGCQKLSYEAALKYLEGRSDARAVEFRRAIKAHHARKEQA